MANGAARTLLRIVGIVAVAYIGVCVMMFALQRSLQYVPDRSIADPAANGLSRVTAEWLATADGERLAIWWAPPAAADQWTYLYLHGNGANLAARARRFQRLIADGSGFYAVSWRGYGGSSGSPTETGLMADARAAYAELARRVPARRIVLFGESLGTTVATMLAAEVSVAALVLDSSFTSALDVAAGAYPFLPVQLLLLDTYRADLAARNVRVPVLQVHCVGDRVTPLELAERQNRMFGVPPRLVRVREACHPVPFPAFEDELRRFLAEVAR